MVKDLKKRESFKIFASYFQDNEKNFERFLNNLSEEQQKKFFKLSIFYRNFVINPPITADFIKDIFAILMIFTLIEALMEDEKYLTFPEFLKRNFKPINTKEELKKIEDEYYDQFGATRRARKFFEKHVDKDCKRIFVYSIRRRNIKKGRELNEEEVVKRNIDLFYKWRSDFVHSAKTLLVLQNYGIFKTGGEIYGVPYKREDFQLLFEHGFLHYFGFSGNLEHSDVDGKIREYIKHTGVKVIWED